MGCKAVQLQRWIPHKCRNFLRKLLKTRGRLYTKETYQLLNWTLIYAYYVSGTPYRWNPRELRVEVVQGKWATARSWCSRLFSLAFGISNLASYVLHGSRNGFDVTTAMGGNRFLNCIVGMLSILFVFSLTTHVHDYATLMTSLVQACHVHNNRVSRSAGVGDEAPQNVHVCNVLQAGILVVMLYLQLSATFCIFVVGCELHVLNGLLPGLTCAHEIALQAPEISAAFLLAMVKGGCVALYQCLALGNYFGALALCIAHELPGTIFLLEILQDFKKNELADHSHFLRTYNCLQLTLNTINSSNMFSFIGPGHLILLYTAFAVVFKAVVAHSTNPMMLSAYVSFCLLMGAHYGYIMRLVWDTTEESRNLITTLKTRNGNSELDQRILTSLYPLKLRFGFMGAFDRDMYIFGATNITGATIDVLLL